MDASPFKSIRFHWSQFESIQIDRQTDGRKADRRVHAILYGSIRVHTRYCLRFHFIEIPMFPYKSIRVLTFSYTFIRVTFIRVYSSPYESIWVHSSPYEFIRVHTYRQRDGETDGRTVIRTDRRVHTSSYESIRVPSVHPSVRPSVPSLPACMDSNGVKLTRMTLNGLVWTCMETFGLVWTYVETYGLVWNEIV